MDFKNFSNTADSPSVDQITIVPSDGADLSQPVKAIYVGNGGDITIVNPKGNTTTFVGVGTGSILPVAAVRVLSTGTDATALVGLI